MTLLAIGNGSPDLFSTFAAFKSNSGEMAIGGLIGAGWFITSVVVGAVAILHPFKTQKRQFLRDILFYTGTTLIIIFLCYRKRIYVFETFLLISYYCSYVGYVVVEDIYFRKKSSNLPRPLLETPTLFQNSGITENTSTLHYKRLSFWTSVEVEDYVKRNKADYFSIPKDPNRYQHSYFLPVSAKFRNMSNIDIPKNRAYRSECTSPTQPTQTLITLKKNYSNNDVNSKLRQTENTETNNYNSQFLAADSISMSSSHISPTSSIAEEESETGLISCLLREFFPTLNFWKEQSFIELSIDILSIPIIILLKVTVPIADFPKGEKDQSEPISQIPSITITRPDNSEIDVSSAENIYVQPDKMKKTVSVLQCIIVPFFGYYFFFIKNEFIKNEYNSLVVIFAIISINVYLHLERTNQLHRWKLMGSIIGFVQGLLWISIISNEIVNILEALGVILKISEEIIGLTILSIGNSLGDFVANFSVAQMGYPTMAISACFAGPMLNTLIGIGGSCLYLNSMKLEYTMVNVSKTVLLSCCLLLLTLILYLILIPIQKFKIGRSFSIAIISIYFIGMLLNVFLALYF